MSLALDHNDLGIPIDDALEDERDLIRLLSYGPATIQFKKELWAQRDSIEALVRHHLALDTGAVCCVLPPETWINGSFNVCVFVDIGVSRRVVFRCAMPHKLAEARYPGTLSEKLSSETGAYVWIQEHCPEIRIPHLYGFGNLNGHHFTHVQHMPLKTRLYKRIWRCISSLFRFPLLSDYVPHPPNQKTSIVYILLEYLGPDTGEMLSKSFHAERNDEEKRLRLFRGISRLMLSLARIPQPRIGSFCFNDDATVTLTNRPVLSSMLINENDTAARIIQPGETYTCTDAFASDMLTFHDHRFLAQPNAVNSETDCRAQMAIKVLLRVLLPRHVCRDRRNGPFCLQLTDLHASNILVDGDWNVTGLIDLEWICALPAEMLAVPYWLTEKGIDELTGDELTSFDKVRRQFIGVLEREEEQEATPMTHNVVLSETMQSMWETKGVWYWYSLSSKNVMYTIFESHVNPSTPLTLEDDTVISRFWHREPEKAVRNKLADKRAYDDELRQLWGCQRDVRAA